jgi:hypothetical protein
MNIYHKLCCSFPFALLLSFRNFLIFSFKGKIISHFSHNFPTAKCKERKVFSLIKRVLFLLLLSYPPSCINRLSQSTGRFLVSFLYLFFFSIVFMISYIHQWHGKKYTRNNRKEYITGARVENSIASK